MAMTTTEKKELIVVRRRLRELLKHVKTTGFKNGDLVVTAEIHRVVDARWGNKNCTNGMEVVTIFPACETCGPRRLCGHSRIMQSSGKGGQQRIMALKLE